MSIDWDAAPNLNIYDEVLNDETICDCSSQGICEVPDLSNSHIICVLYLQNNKIAQLPDSFFTSLPALMWLDLRDNQLTDIPITISNHQNLTHLLLQNNKITSLPNELGTVHTLKVLQLTGNPLMYPPRDVIQAGVSNVLKFLHDKFLENIFVRSQSDLLSEAESVKSTLWNNDHYNENTSVSTHGVSYNSVLDNEKAKTTKLTIQFNERESGDSDYEYYGKLKGKCHKLAKSRGKTLPKSTQSSKYLKPLMVGSPRTENEKIKQNFFKDLAIKKHKDLLASRDRILQDRKNKELLKHWRTNYRYKQLQTDGSYKLDPRTFPYDTDPDLTLLTREDLEKDLPNKYRKKLIRRCKPTVPRKSNNDVHLALKIKQLFDNLEAIDLNKEGLTPRTEQRVLLNEIQKISEIKQKLQELSTTNVRSVVSD